MRHLFLHVYTILVYALLYPFTLLNSLLVIVLDKVGLQSAIPGILVFWAKGTFVILGKHFRIEGRENIEKNHKYILIANHSSLFDIMAIMAICPGLSWFGRERLLKVPVFGRLLQVINYIPMKSTDLRNVKQMISQLVESTQNRTVAIFPEGTRTVDGRLNPFRRGFLHVMRASCLDILPVSLTGFYEFKPKNRFHFDYPAKLSAQIHPPISYHDLEKLEDQEIINKVKTIIETAIFK